MMKMTYPTKKLVPFYSAAYTRSYLTKSYERINIDQAKTKSFHTCYSFIYHLKHGNLYIDQAKKAPMDLKPMLLFYGLVQFLKAIILTKDPTYPENSQVLAHGVTTRKRKKSGFIFLDDEVKIQKNGLFTHALGKMFHMKHLANDKFKMRHLLQQLPEMESLFIQFNQQSFLFKGTFHNHSIQYDSSILDSYHMTVNRFEQYIKYKEQPWSKKGVTITEGKQLITIPYSKKPSPSSGFPFTFDDQGHPYLFRSREGYLGMPELLVHYLLLYNLSMICRYETEWWGELIHTFDGNDLPFITQYIDFTTSRIGALVVDTLLPDRIK
jgi:hypothetical protein